MYINARKNINSWDIWSFLKMLHIYKIGISTYRKRIGIIGIWKNNGWEFTKIDEIYQALQEAPQILDRIIKITPSRHIMKNLLKY